MLCILLGNWCNLISVLRKTTLNSGSVLPSFEAACPASFRHLRKNFSVYGFLSLKPISAIRQEIKPWCMDHPYCRNSNNRNIATNACWWCFLEILKTFCSYRFVVISMSCIKLQQIDKLSIRCSTKMWSVTWLEVTNAF